MCHEVPLCDLFNVKVTEIPPGGGPGRSRGLITEVPELASALFTPLLWSGQLSHDP